MPEMTDLEYDRLIQKLAYEVQAKPPRATAAKLIRKDAEIADLRQRLTTAREAQAVLQEAVTAQDAEIKRLRAALESIINRNVMHENHGAYLSPDNNEEEFQDIKRIARAALGDE